MESESWRFGTEFGFLAFLKTEFISDVTGVEFLAGSHQVENGADQFVGGPQLWLSERPA